MDAYVLYLKVTVVATPVSAASGGTVRRHMLDFFLKKNLESSIVMSRTVSIASLDLLVE